jgi:hypothetical protein
MFDNWIDNLTQTNFLANIYLSRVIDLITPGSAQALVWFAVFKLGHSNSNNSAFALNITINYGMLCQSFMHWWGLA